MYNILVMLSLVEIYENIYRKILYNDGVTDEIRDMKHSSLNEYLSPDDQPNVNVIQLRDIYRKLTGEN